MASHWPTTELLERRTTQDVSGRILIAMPWWRQDQRKSEIVTTRSPDVEVVEHEPPAEHIPLSRDRQAALEASDREREERRRRNADLARQEFAREIGSE